jgi:hypothetical protein
VARLFAIEANVAVAHDVALLTAFVTGGSKGIIRTGEEKFDQQQFS